MQKAGTVGKKNKQQQQHLAGGILGFGLREALLLSDFIDLFNLF